MLFARYCADEVLKDETETVLRLSRRKRGQYWLLAQDQFDLRNDLRNHAAIDVQSFREFGAPRNQTIFAFCQQLLDETSKRLNQGPERRAARNLVELARDEISALSSDGLIQLLNKRSLSYTCVA